MEAKDIDMNMGLIDAIALARQLAASEETSWSIEQCSPYDDYCSGFQSDFGVGRAIDDDPARSLLLAIRQHFEKYESVAAKRQAAYERLVLLDVKSLAEMVAGIRQSPEIREILKSGELRYYGS